MEFAFPIGENCADRFRANDSWMRMTRDRSFIMVSYLLVGIGGAIGSVARFWMSGLIATRFGQTFPLGTLIVNVTGSFVIGLFAALSEPEERWLVHPSFRQFFMIGICGGYTTFSSFSLQTFALAQEGEWFHATMNTIASFALCLFAVWLGYFTITLINKP
jgi:CrcB protein